MVGSASLIGGAVITPVFLILGFLLYIVIGIVNVILGILIWIAELIGLLGGNPIPNGVLPDPYFTYVLEGLLLAGFAIGAFYLVIFLKVGNEDTPLQEELDVPILTIVVPSAVFGYLYALYTPVPYVTEIVTVALPTVTPPVAFYGIVGFSLVVTNRARRLALETARLSERRPRNARSNSFVATCETLLEYAFDTATYASILGLAVIGYLQALDYTIRRFPGESAATSREATELFPAVDLVVTSITMIAIVTLAVSVVYYGVRTGYSAMTRLRNR